MATELAKAYVQIVPTAKGIKGAIENELNDEAISAGQSSGQKLGAGLVTAMKGAMIAAGIGAVIKESLSAGADLQQSFGGLDTIYGDAAEAAKAYAFEAAQAGISANDYAEQAVSFGASLKQAFGGDTAAAVEAANTAIMDMTDNAAKMGTPIEQIQNAYQGFAKGQYQLLDNLKIGYGGTREEMLRLLADAEALTGVKYDINNLGDVYEAIHVIQEDLGLTGVAAQEASTTFSGSFGAMQAAAQNLLASLSTGEGVGAALTTLAGTIEAFITNNLIPMLGNIISSIPEVVSTAAPLLFDALSGVINQAPQVLEAGRNMVQQMATGFLESLPNMISAAGTLLQQLLDTILTNLPKFMEQGANFVMNMVNGIVSNMPSILAAITNLIAQLIATIVSHLPEILQKGIEIVAKLVAGLIQAIPQVVAAIPKIIKAIVDGFKNTDWGSVGTNIIKGIANGLSNGFSILKDAAMNAAREALNAAKSFLGINSPSKVFRDQVGAMMAEGMAEGFENNMPTAEIEHALMPMSSIVPNTLGGSQYSYGGFTINVYGAPGQDINELANIVGDRINAQIARGRAVFA